MTSFARPREEWLQDIVVWCDKLERHILGFDEAMFLENEKTQDAAARCLEAIGEAANQLLKSWPELPALAPDLELRSAYANRNRLAHAYFVVDQVLVWEAASNSAPRLRLAAFRVLDAMKNNAVSRERGD